MQTVTLEKGYILFRQGSASSEAYLVKEGNVDVYTEQHDGNRYVLAQIGPGEVVGEMALLQDKDHSATARITQDSVLIPIKRSDLHNKYEDSDPVLKQIIYCLVNRLHKANVELAKYKQKE